MNKTPQEIWRRIVALESKPRLTLADRNELAQLRDDYSRARAEADA